MDGAALGMPRHHNRQQAGKAVLQPSMHVDQFDLLAGMRRGGGDHRAGADGGLELPELRRIGRRRGHVELQVAGRDITRSAEAGEARGVLGGLRKAEIEAAEQGSDRARHEPPALERTLRDAAVHQYQRNVAVGARHDQVRPQVRFGKQREVGPPVIEEARDELRHVERGRIDGSRPAAIAASPVRPR